MDKNKLDILLRLFGIFIGFILIVSLMFFMKVVIIGNVLSSEIYLSSLLLFSGLVSIYLMHFIQKNILNNQQDPNM